ncbi:hypothetical protein Hanom_Chr10g00927771 [Helianthus anomalus]
MKPFEDMVDFMDRSRIKKVLTDWHKCYKSHIEMVWNNARFDDGTKEIVSALKIKDDKCKDIDIEVKFNVRDVRRVLELKDDDKDQIQKKGVEIKKKRVVCPKATKLKPAAKRVSKKKSPPRLVDEPIDLPLENVDVIVTGEPVSDYLNVQGSMSFDDLENIIAGENPARAAQLVKEKVAKAVAQAAKNVEAATGGEALKETIVEGEWEIQA